MPADYPQTLIITPRPLFLPEMPSAAAFAQKNGAFRLVASNTRPMARFVSPNFVSRKISAAQFLPGCSQPANRDAPVFWSPVFLKSFLRSPSVSAEQENLPRRRALPPASVISADNFARPIRPPPTFHHNGRPHNPRLRVRQALRATARPQAFCPRR